MGLEAFGKASLENGFVKTLTQKLSSPDFKKGETYKEYIYRIIPPIKKMRNDEKGWRVYRAQHYGYKVPSSKEPENPEKAYHKPFLCIEERDRQSKMITRECPECKNIRENEALKKEKMEEAFATAKKNGMDDVSAKEYSKNSVKTFTVWLMQHNCDRKWRVNAKGLDNKFCLLLLTHTEMKALEEAGRKMKENNNIDYLDPSQGIWWKFTVTGQGLEKKVTVEPVMDRKVINGETFFKPKMAPLTEEDGDRVEKELTDLTDGIAELSAEQIQLLVTCSGDPAEVKKIMNLSREHVSERSPAPRVAAPVTVQAPIVVPVAATIANSETEEEDDEEAELNRKMAELQAKKQAKAASKNAPKPAPTAKQTEDFDYSAVKDMDASAFEALCSPGDDE